MRRQTFLSLTQIFALRQIPVAPICQPPNRHSPTPKPCIAIHEKTYRQACVWAAQRDSRPEIVLRPTFPKRLFTKRLHSLDIPGACRNRLTRYFSSARHEMAQPHLQQLYWPKRHLPDSGT